MGRGRAGGGHPSGGSHSHISGSHGSSHSHSRSSSGRGSSSFNSSSGRGGSSHGRKGCSPLFTAAIIVLALIVALAMVSFIGSLLGIGDDGVTASTGQRAKAEFGNAYIADCVDDGIGRVSNAGTANTDVEIICMAVVGVCGVLASILLMAGRKHWREAERVLETERVLNMPLNKLEDENADILAGKYL